MIVKKDVLIDGIQLTRWSSSNPVKICCDLDGNIYPIAYTTKNSSVQFTETNLPLNEISVGIVVQAEDIQGLSTYISSTMDILDGARDNKMNFDGGTATI